MGIDTGRLHALAMALSLAVVAVAGIFLGIRTTFTFSSGPDRLLFAFEAVIIGGLGSLWGTLVGGVILGVAQTLGAKLSPGWGVLTGHLVFLAVLLLRPAGLFAKSRRVD
jgi:branched-chain amino acid transport system permease protein